MLQGAAQSLGSKIQYTKDPHTVLPTATFRETLILMAQKKVKRIPIVDNKKRLMGIISRHDIMKALHDDIQTHGF